MMEDSRDINIRKQIEAYIKGQLKEDDIQKLWNEFAKKPELLDILELEVNVKELIERRTKETGSAEKTKSVIHRMPKWSWYAAAAAVIFMVVLVQFFRIDGSAGLDQMVAQHIGAAEIETSNTVRAKDMRLTSADSLLNLGFQAFLSGNDSRALALYEEIITKYDEEPYGSKAFLNKGIIHYNNADYRLAIDSFNKAAERAQNSRMISEKAYWYMGNALVNIGELEEAKTAVTKAYQLDGVFRSPAFRLLKKLNEELGYSDFEEVNLME